MKQLISILFFIFIYSSSFSQREKFDCHNISTTKLLNKYEQYKSYGLEIKKSGNGKTVDFMKEMILVFDYGELRQLCINAWGVVEENGENNCYLKFTNNFSSISKSAYLEDIDYIEILVLLNKEIKAKL